MKNVSGAFFVTICESMCFSFHAFFIIWDKLIMPEFSSRYTCLL